MFVFSQADNNNFSGSSIPTTYKNISTLLKLLVSFYIHINFKYLPMMISQHDDIHFHLADATIVMNIQNTSYVIRSLRNCSLQGAIPDLSGISQLIYL